MAWTSHGYWIGHGEPDDPRPPRRPCGGPHRCPSCALEAQHIAHEDQQRWWQVAGPSVTIGISPQPEKLIRMLRIIAAHAKGCREELAGLDIEETIAALGIIARHAEGCADELEAAQEDDVSQERADDGMPPTA